MYKHLKIVICLILLVSILCSCGKSSEPDNQTETNETTKQTESISEENNDNETERKNLRVYDNGSHTLAIWNYDKDQETMTLIFDESKVIYSYFVFEEMNTEETVTLFNGSDKDYNWRIQVNYNNIEDSLGYGTILASVLDRHMCSPPNNGLLKALYSTHPHSDDRVARLQDLGANYSRY